MYGGTPMRNLEMFVTMVAVLISNATFARDTAPAVDESAVRAQKMHSEMNKGKNYADAWAVVPTDVDVVQARERVARHQAAMTAGKDHTDAREMPTGDTDAVMSNARRHADAMNRGLDHEDARAASHASR
jgi:hypothetical protein